MLKYSGGMAVLVIVLAAGMAAITDRAPGATANAQPVPDGPRLAYQRSGSPVRGRELLTVGPADGKVKGIARTKYLEYRPFESLAWSSDGAIVAFTEADSFVGYPRRAKPIEAAPAKGGPRVRLPGTRGGDEPAFSPDGELLAFVRYQYRFRNRQNDFGIWTIGSAIWMVDTETWRARPLTPWKKGRHLRQPSFAPDSRSLIAVRDFRGQAPEIVRIHLDSGAIARLFTAGWEPEASPRDGTIAFVRRKEQYRLHGGDLFVADADGSNIRRLTFEPDRGVASPSWDPSGRRIAYTQYPSLENSKGSSIDASAIFQINADGSCRRWLLFTYGLFYGSPAWRPGPGRGAGRIEC